MSLSNSKRLSQIRSTSSMLSQRRGISPVVATTLLIAMVVVLALIVFLWFRGFTEESVTKFGGTNIKLVCADVQFESSYSGGELFISNIGNVPIYSFKLKIEGAGSSDLVNIEDATGTWPEAGLNLNGVFTGTISVAEGAQEIIVIPVLRGTSDKGARSHTCDEQYGVIVSV